MTIDGAGNLFVLDSCGSTLRKVKPDASVSTLATGLHTGYHLCYPSGVAVDGSGNVFVADTEGHTIRKVSPSGDVTTVAGLSGNAGSLDGQGSAARFSYPTGMGIDAAGNLFVATSWDHTLRKVTPDGYVTTLAGQPGVAGSADGDGASARFSGPMGVAVDRTGTVYVADTGNNAIRTVSPSGQVTTLAGRKTTQGIQMAGGGIEPFSPNSLAVDAGGTIYVGDGCAIRKITEGGEATTFAGLQGSCGAADGAGSEARFNSSSGLAMDAEGNVFVSDSYSSTIRKVTPSGSVTTLAGRPGAGGSADGPGNLASFSNPSGLAVDRSGVLFVADTSNSTIRKVTSSGFVSTLAGRAGARGGTDGIGSGALFYLPRGVAVDGTGRLLVADTYNFTIRRVTPEGVVTTLAGSVGSSGSDDGTGSQARFAFPKGIAVDLQGNAYVTDDSSIRKMTPSGSVTTIGGVAVAAGENSFTPAKKVALDGTGSFARFLNPTGVAVAPSGNVLVADPYEGSIRVGRPALPDMAVIDSSTGRVGEARQLDVSPRTASSWLWEEVRIEGFSRATLSSTTMRNPTFTPDVPGRYFFRVTATDGGGSSSITEVGLVAGDSSCFADTSTLCLLGDRFSMTADWTAYDGRSGRGRAVPLSSDTGSFWFFTPTNVEVVAKMVSFCGSGANNVAVYAGGLTDIDVTLHVTDTRTGTTKDYHNALGKPFTPVKDGPFGCPASATDGSETVAGKAGDERPGLGTMNALRSSGGGPSPSAMGTSDAKTLYLGSNRFQVRALYQDYSGKVGSGQAVPSTSDSGYFWFFDAANVEVLAKVVSFCGSGTNNIGIYTTGLTDVGVTLTVTDTWTGLVKTYKNRIGTPFDLIRDGSFACH